MTTAEEIVALTERVHLLASTPLGSMMTRSELERLAAQQMTAEQEGEAAPPEPRAGAGHR